MTAKASAVVLFVTLGATAAFAVTSSPADPPIHIAQATIYKTVTETRTQQYQGKGVRWWAAHAVRNRRTVNHQRITLRRIRRHIRAVWHPTVTYGLTLARIVYGVDQTNRARCESGLNPYAEEGHGPLGLLQFQPGTWASTPFGGFSIWDPVAQALAGGWMVRAGRSGEWSCRL